MKSIIICGVGSIGKRHIENFGKLFDCIDIVDINPDRVKESISKYKIRNHYQNVAVALSAKKYDAVVIAVPPHLHQEIAVEAIKNKSNLFIEKPLGMSSNGWQKLYEDCKKIINISSKDLIIDIGSNDGNLLNNFKKYHQVLGITPEKIGKIAIKNGIRTLIRYFDRNTSKLVLRKFGKAK